MPKAKNYEGLFGCPAQDLNFASGLERLTDAELQEFHEKLVERETEEQCHKGRIKAVEKAIKARATASREIVAVERMSKEIDDVERLYSDGMSYDLERIREEIMFYEKSAAASFIELGKRFIRIKAHEEHGKFLAVVESAGMSIRSVQYAMLAALKFANTQATAHLGNEKIRVLTVLDEEDIAKLDSGGKVKGMTFDDIDRMSVRELRENLRKSDHEIGKLKEARKKDRDSFEKSLTAKDAKLNEYELRESGMEPPTKEKIAVNKAEELRKEIFGKLLIASQYMSEAETLSQQITRIPDITDGALTEIKELLAEPYQALCESYLALEDMWNEFFPEKNAEAIVVAEDIENVV